MEDQLTRSDKHRLSRLATRLRDWHVSAGRVLPWRDPATTRYRAVCVEVLLQRTRAETVAAFYHDFFERYPGWDALDRAPVEEIEVALRPVGLWRRRARSLKGLAAYAVSVGGAFPDDRAELERAPGIGQYVASAILLFHHGRREPLLDVNMARVIERGVRPRRLADIRHDFWLQEAARWLLRRGDPTATNWAVLDLGAAFCRARNPACATCPAARACTTGRHAKVDSIHHDGARPRLHSGDSQLA